MTFLKVVSRLEQILSEIINANVDKFEESGEFIVETQYGNTYYQLDEIDESEDLCLQGLVHHAMYKEDLYAMFLNDSQLGYMKYMISESPYYIYYPDPKSNEGSHEDVIEDLKALEIIEKIHHRMIHFVARELLGHGFDVPVLEEYLDESDDEEEE